MTRYFKIVEVIQIGICRWKFKLENGACSNISYPVLVGDTIAYNEDMHYPEHPRTVLRNNKVVYKQVVTDTTSPQPKGNNFVEQTDVDEATQDIYNMVFQFLDQIPELNGDQAGTIAAKVEMLVKEELQKIISEEG